MFYSLSLLLLISDFIKLSLVKASYCGCETLSDLWLTYIMTLSHCPVFFAQHVNSWS